MGIVQAILKRPSQRTLMESSLVGITMLMLISLATSIYLVFFTDMSLWIRILSGLGEISILLFMFSNLATQYVQYYTFKLQMGLYPADKKLLMKLEEAKRINKELEELIKENEAK